MKKIIIFGNSGSGKSTLAREIGQTHHLAHLDLDSIAWTPESPPTRAPISESARHILAFIATHSQWVIEGCYADLIEIVLPDSNEMIFLDLPISHCIENAKARPWEPHKYASKAAQDANLAMLIDWIAEYDNRQDTFSRAAHQLLFDRYAGQKTRRQHNNAR